MLWHTKAPSPDKPFRDELLSIERLEERALALAASFTIDPSPRRRARNIFPRFNDNARVLRDAYRTLADDVRTGQPVTAAAEWLLDNFHLVTSEIRDIRQHLPGTYYRQLPALASREQAGHTRIYAMAVELVRHSDSRIDRQQLAVFVNSYQRVAPLTIGELWAWPSMLKLALIENLRRLAVETLESRRARLAADAYVSRIEGETSDAARPLPPALDITSVVQLLHRVREYGLRLSSIRTAVEEHLASHADDRGSGHSRRAPAPGGQPGVGGQRDHQPAPLLRHRLAPVRRVGQPGRAGAAARSRRRVRADGLPQPRSAASGGRGARRAERRRAGAGRAASGRKRPAGGRQRVARRSGRARRVPPHRSRAARPRGRRRVSTAAREPGQTPGVRARDAVLPRRRSPSMTAVLLTGGAAYARHEGASARAIAALVLLLLIPAADIAIALAQRVIAWAIPPRRLSRLDFSDRSSGRGPHDGRRADDADEHRARWRRCWSTSRCSRWATSIRTSISRSSAISPTPSRASVPGDSPILAAARAGIESLNRRFGAGACGSLLSVSSRSGAGMRASTRGWDGSASAARSRSSTGC